jgi:hypothetical protein
MTHGEIWLPLDPRDPNSPLLRCRTSSDGYLSGCGLGAWSSSRHIEIVCQASTLFAGSVFFAHPKSAQLTAKDGDYLLDGLEDLDPDDAPEPALVAEIDKSLQLLLAGDLAGAQATALGLIPLERRLKFFEEAELLSAEDAWLEFSCGAELPDKAASAQACVDHLLLGDEGGFPLDTHCSYFWRDGQFYGKGMVGDDYSREIVLPLGMLHAVLGDATGCYGDGALYLADMTAPDAADIDLLAEALAQRGGDPSASLFDGAIQGLLAARTQKSELDAAIGAARARAMPKVL